MSDVVLEFNHGATINDGYICFEDGLHTAIEPIYLDVDLSIEEYELEIGDEEEIDTELETAIQVTKIIGDEYEGPYIVDPTFSDQELETKNLVMADNVTVNRIAVSTVENPSGGNTVFIGGMF